jgi:hypothetical protein
VTSAVVEKL